MSKIFPKFVELYTAIIKDCHKIYLQNVYNKVVKKIKQENIKDILNKLELYCVNHSQKNNKYSDLTSFTLKYFNKISNFFRQNEKNNIEAKYLDYYCLSYISLVGFNCYFTDIKNDDELFLFKQDKYINFTELIKKLNANQLKEFYELHSKNIKNEYQNDKNLYLNLIIKFDADYQFHTKLIEEKKEANKEISIVENNNNKNQLFSESNNGYDSNTTQEKSGNKNSKEDNEKSNNNIISLYKNNNPININNDLSNKNEIEYEFKIQNDKPQIDNKSEKKLDFNKIQISNLVDIKDRNINEKFFCLELKMEISEIKFDYKLIKTEYNLYEESEFNYANINALKNENNYLQIYIKSLKNIIINISNPCNFNYWRKLANIILKNIFIILKNNKFTIKQNKDQSILEQIKLENNNVERTDTLNPYADKERRFNLIIIEKNGKEDIKASLTIDFLFYLKEKGNKFDHFDESIINYILFDNLSIEEVNENESDKKNVELLEKNNIKSTENKKINEDLEKNIIINEIEDKTKEKTMNINESKNDKTEVNNNTKDFITNVNEIKNNVPKINEIKNITKVDEAINRNDKETKNGKSKIKNNICNEIKNGNNDINNKIKNTKTEVNESKNVNKKIDNKQNMIIKIEKIDVKNNKEIKNDIKTQIINNEINSDKKEEDNIINERANKNEEEKDNKTYNLKIDYEGKQIFSGTELIEIFKNPEKYQRKDSKIKNLLNPVYEKIDNLKNKIGYKRNNIKLIELIQRTNDLKSRIKELIEKIENYINNNYNNVDLKILGNIDIKKIINDLNLQELLNNYFLLLNLYNEIEQKVKFYENNSKIFFELDEIILNKEKEINNIINIIQKKIENDIKLIKINDVFEEYKSDLKNNQMKKSEYKSYSNTFNLKNIDEFKLNDALNFLEKYLKNQYFSIS